MVEAARNKALVLSFTLATFSVDKKAPERRKYGRSDWSIFESEKEKAEDFKLQRNAAQSRLLLKESSAVS